MGSAHGATRAGAAAATGAPVPHHVEAGRAEGRQSAGAGLPTVAAPVLSGSRYTLAARSTLKMNSKLVLPAALLLVLCLVESGEQSQASHINRICCQGI